MFPEYVCGVVWSFAAAATLALSVTVSEAAAAVQRVATVIRPLKVPDLAVGFLLAVFGVLVPYAAAIIFGPFSDAIGNAIYKRWYRQRPSGRLPASYSQIVAGRIQKTFGVPEPPIYAGDFLAAYLQHARTPAWPPLARRLRAIDIQGKSLLPASVLVGAAAYAVTGQHWWSALVGIAFAVLMFTSVIHLSIASLVIVHTQVGMLFLQLTAASEP